MHPCGTEVLIAFKLIILPPKLLNSSVYLKKSSVMRSNYILSAISVNQNTSIISDSVNQ